MKRKTVRTLMVGVMLVSLGMLLQYSPAVFAKTPLPPRESAVGGAAGRYQIVMNPNVRADTFLLDTATGVVWTLVKYTDLKGQPQVWDVMIRLDSLKEFQEFVDALKRYEKTPEPRGSSSKESKTPDPLEGAVRVEDPDPATTTLEPTEFPRNWSRRFKLQ